MDNGYTGYRVPDTTKHPGSRSAARCDGNTGSGFEIIVKFTLYFSTLNMRGIVIKKKTGIRIQSFFKTLLKSRYRSHIKSFHS